MEFKYMMNHNVSAQIPAWIVLELWELINQVKKNNTTEYADEDLEELLSVLNHKVTSIQNAVTYQREHFGRSKYDL